MNPPTVLGRPDAPLLSVTYTSSATRLLSVTQLVELIEQIRPKNERLGVTGLLLYSGGTVVQTLEGEEPVVDDLLSVITGDPRHDGLRVLERRAIRERAYATWAMGFRNVAAREVAAMQDFGSFARESLGTDLAPHAEAAFGLLGRFRVNAG